MLASEIEFWIKNTITGLLVLSVIGGIATICVWRFFSRLIKHWIPLGWRGYRKNQTRFEYGHGYTTSILIHGKTPSVVVGYFAYHVVRAIGYMLFAAFFLFVLIVALPAAGVDQNVLTIGTYVASLCMVLSIYLAYREYLPLKLFYLNIILPHYQAGVEKHEKSGDKKNTD